MAAYLWIAVGSALGGLARYWCTVMAHSVWPIALPWGTIAINVAGSLVIGLVAGWGQGGRAEPLSADVRAFLAVGLCGGFTTFSSFALQTVDLARAGASAAALLNIALSVVLCVAAAALGQSLARALS